MKEELHVESAGAGPGTPLVLVHGFPLDGRMWEHQRQRLSQGRLLLVPDLAGFGLSPMHGDGHSVEDHAQDLAGMLEARSISSAVVCGFSMGGYVALACAALFPRNVAGLILANTRASADTPDVRQARTRSAQRLLREGTDFLVEEMAPKLVSAAAQQGRPDLMARLRTIMAAQSPEACAAAQIAMRERQDRTADLAGVRCPVLVVVGAEDAVTPPADARAMARTANKAEFVEVPLAGHAACMERADVFNDALAAFLARWAL